MQMHLKAQFRKLRLQPHTSSNLSPPPPQSSGTPREILICTFISNDAYRKVETLIKHTVKVYLCGYSVPIGEDMTIRAIHHSYVWNDYYSVVSALRHSCCLRRDRGRERETEFLYGIQPKSLAVKNSVKKFR
jgi:hypothetical protein